MAPRRPSDDWPDFTETARLQFWGLPDEAVEAFATVFPEFTRFPQRPSTSLDVCPLRNDPRRWRLKVLGYRAIYQVLHGRPIIEAVLPRSNRTYRDFEAHRRRFPPR